MTCSLHGAIRGVKWAWIFSRFSLGLSWLGRRASWYWHGWCSGRRHSKSRSRCRPPRRRSAVRCSQPSSAESLAFTQNYLRSLAHACAIATHGSHRRALRRAFMSKKPSDSEISVEIRDTETMLVDDASVKLVADITRAL